ncbi:MAG: thioredoxin domain-containing protein [Chloroflexota bacterium]
MTNSQKSIRAERKQRAKRQKQTQSIGMIIIGLLILVGAGLGLSYAADRAIVLVDPPGYSHPSPDMNAIGNPDAPVVVYEYSSFACSHCYNFFTDSEGLFIQNYVETGLVYYIYMPYHTDPNRIDTIGAHAAMCAGEQGAFWDMHDMLFANFATGYTRANIDQMAEYFELDMAAYEACMDSEKYYEQIINDTQNAYVELGVEGTPSFIINGELAVIGNEGYQALANAVEAALETSGAE